MTDMHFTYGKALEVPTELNVYIKQRFHKKEPQVHIYLLNLISVL